MYMCVCVCVSIYIFEYTTINNKYLPQWGTAVIDTTRDNPRNDGTSVYRHELVPIITHHRGYVLH